MSWSINNGPGKSDKYEWEAGEKDREGVLTDTVAPGDLNVKPEDFDIAPTLAPATTGIQSGIFQWEYDNQPDSSWYIQGCNISEN